MMSALHGRVVVISPHPDDAALSLGATIAAGTRAGAAVTILTVLGGDPQSSEPAGPWDRQCGFATRGEASAARAKEDADACALLGATPMWLPFGDEQYDRGGSAGGVAACIAEVTAGADLVLLPGLPLTHADHAWVTGAVLELPSGSSSQIAFFAEQPYADRPTSPPRLSEQLRQAFPHGVRSVRPRVRLRDRVTKVRAIRCYRSQLELLGLGTRGSPKAALQALRWQEIICYPVAAASYFARDG